MITLIIDRIRREMFSAFSALDDWCNTGNDLLEYKPPQGWTIREILEHVTLTNHFLLLIINKGTAKALHRGKSGIFQRPRTTQ